MVLTFVECVAILQTNLTELIFLGKKMKHLQIRGNNSFGGILQQLRKKASSSNAMTFNCNIWNVNKFREPNSALVA